jgi:hypothetical protein
MYAVNVLLFLGAAFLALFTIVFLAGAVIHLSSSIRDAVRATMGVRGVKAQAPQPGPATQPTMPFKALQTPRRGHLAALLGCGFGRSSPLLNQPSWLKTCAVAVGLIAVGLFAITVAEDTASALHAFAAPEVQGTQAAAPAVAAVPEQPASPDDRLLRGPSDSNGVPAGAPRECSLQLGIVTDCSFN